MKISKGNPARSRRGLLDYSRDRPRARTMVTILALVAKAAPPTWNREAWRPRRRHKRRDSRTLPPASRQDVGWKATRACRLSLKAQRDDLGQTRRSRVDLYNPCVLARAGAWLDRAAFNPQSLPDDLTFGIALDPPVVAGLIIFKLPAVEMLTIAFAFGISGHILALLLWRRHMPPPQASPLLAAVIGVALVGAGARLAASIAIAALAVTLELVRARYVPAIRAQTGLFAYAIVAMVTRGAPFMYANTVTGKAAFDPIWIWHQYFGPQAP